MNSAVQAVLSAAASLVFIALIVAIVYAISRCGSSLTRSAKARPESDSRIRARPSRDLTSVLVDESASYDPSLEISMAELVRATANFADDGVVGDGGFGLVYKACLSSGVTVAAKKLCKDAFQGLREFRAEMDTLGRLRHPHLVKILGFCAFGSDRVLVYEFMDNGSLDHWLHEPPPPPPSPQLPWDRRVRIVRGVANGLSYLHSLKSPIIHRDIKASNVLLDSSFEAHIADFGLARMLDSSRSHVSTQVAGTMGYMPPEYREGVTAATVKADMYSFGVLMLEVATARRPSWPVRDDGGSEVGMVQWARTMAAERREMEMVDSSLGSMEGKKGEVREFFRIACLCTSEMPRERPTMGEVVDLLDRTWK